VTSGARDAAASALASLARLWEAIYAEYFLVPEEIIVIARKIFRNRKI